MKKKNSQDKKKLILLKTTIQKLQHNQMTGIAAGSGDPRCKSHDGLCGSSEPHCTCPKPRPITQ